MTLAPSILVSIIVPTYNRSDLLAKALISVQNQTFQNWECIVIDDGSSDETASLVKNFSDNDPRFKYFLRADCYPKGACGSRNYGFIKSIGKYIQWLDDDDLLSENKLEFQVKMLEENNDSTYLTTCDWDVYWEGKSFEAHNVTTKDEVLHTEGFFQSLVRRETFVPPNAFLTPRKLVILAGPWNSHLSINQDAEYFTRILLVSEGLINTPGCHVLYRIHAGERISSSFNSENLASLIYGYRLIQAHLSLKGLTARKFLKWKLRKLILMFGKSDKEVIAINKSLFIENGLYPSRYRYYIARYKLFKLIKPLYKRYLK